MIINIFGTMRLHPKYLVALYLLSESDATAQSKSFQLIKEILVLVAGQIVLSSVVSSLQVCLSWSTIYKIRIYKNIGNKMDNWTGKELESFKHPSIAPNSLHMRHCYPL